MAAHRYWRAVNFDALKSGDLELTEFQLLAGATRVDASATLTSSVAPTLGSLSSLNDGSATTAAIWAAASVRGLTLNWDFGGSPANVTDIRLGAGVQQDRFAFFVVLQWSDDGVNWNNFYQYLGITWPGANTLTASVAVLDQIILHFNGANGSTTFTEDGGKTVTKAGTTGPVISTAQSKYGGASGQFSASGYLTVPYVANTGDFFLSMSFLFAANPASQQYIFTLGSIACILATNGTVTFYVGSTYAISAVLAVSTWHTLSWERRGGVFTVMMDGVVLASSVLGITFTGGNLFVGANSLGGANPFSGFIDEVYYIAEKAYSDNAGFPTGEAVYVPSRIGRTATRAQQAGPVVSVASRASNAITMGQTRIRNIILGRKDYLTGVTGQGVGRVKGTTKDKGSPNVPVSERVRLYRQRDGLLIRETWSKLPLGAYSFDYVDEVETYTVISYDHDGNFRAVVADGLTLAGGGVELIA